MIGSELPTMADIAERISQAIGRTVRYVKVAPDKDTDKRSFGWDDNRQFWS